MTRIATALGLVLAVAACGADGEPQPPAPKQAAAPGIRVSGTARVGISVSQSGAKPYAYGVAGPGAALDTTGF